MNYLKIYCNLIRKAENRTPPEVYTEKHHIFPVSIFGKNNRIVVLTARDDSSCMYKVSKGKYDNHKGWKCRKLTKYEYA